MVFRGDSNMVLLVSTVGRPTMAIKTRVQIIIKYNVTSIIGLIPKGDRENDQVFDSIMTGWEKETSLISETKKVDLSEYFIDLDFFYFQDSHPLLRYSRIERDSEILNLSYEIINKLNSNNNHTIIFDLASGRRILSGICLTIARFLQDLGRSSESKMKSGILDKLRSIKIIVLTRPTPTQRIYVDAKQLENGEFPPIELEGQQGQVEAGIHEFTFHPYPVLKLKEYEILQLWEVVNHQKEIGKILADKYNLKENSGERQVGSFKNNILLPNQLIAYKNSNKLTISGQSFLKFYDLLMSDGK